MNGKKWSISLIILYMAGLFFIGILVIIIDPYFHYHAPIKGLAYSLENGAYVNDGVSKNFDYNAMIIGTSMTRGFKTAEANEAFDKNFIRITLHGEGFKRINDNMEAAIAANPDLKFIVRGVDTLWLVTDANWQGYEEYPDYLYDNILWNDVNYLYNKEILCNDVISEIVRTIRNEPADQFDNYIKGDLTGKERVLKAYERPPKEEKVIEQEETDAFFHSMEKNLEENVLSAIENNPDITFYIFFPPYSICWWDSLNQLGVDVLVRRIHMEQFAIEKLLLYDNVQLFSFFNNYDLICDLDNYTDECHYSDKVSSEMLIWMKEGKYELTKENYLDYIKDITDFYSNYDYDSIFD